MLRDGWYRSAKLLARLMMPTFGRVEVEGVENVPPFGPLIIAANHQSNADPPVLVHAFPRPIWFVAKRGLFVTLPVRYILRRLHARPVARDGRDVDAVKWAIEQVAQDHALLIFPEGTRSPGALAPGGDGLAYLALRTQAPIIPVGITGTERINNYARVAFPFTRIKVAIGEPFTLPVVEGRLPRAALHSMTEMIMERIAALLPQPYRGVYGAERCAPGET
ncbi:MAG: lysophospholipid acyltransferase family protein [Chloroflexota bacterium]|nr:lysophospholipid acyltransferase family protein [Chloroflexota bacterium]